VLVAGRRHHQRHLQLGVTIGDVVRVVLLFYLMPLWAVLLARVLLASN
jgi:positive regulator of sigma E activity